MIKTRMDRRLFLISASAMALSACGNILGPPEAPQMYALRPAPPPPQPGGKVDWALSIALPTVPDNLDSTRIALSRGETQFDYYANAMWPDHPSDMVQTALLAGFEASGRIDSVSREEDVLHADYMLLTDLRDFEARYAGQEGTPTVSVRIVSQLSDTHTRKIVSSLIASFDEPATANNVDAVVEAFDAALAKAVAQITQWVLTLPLSGAGRSADGAGEAPAASRTR
jgi:cholesterol transport system auxiliary component